MKERDNQNLRFSLNPVSIVLGSKRKKGLRCNYVASSLYGFYINTLKTGATLQTLSNLLSNNLNFKDTPSAIQSFEFLMNEGDRSFYNILLPFLLSAKSAEEFEKDLRKRFFGVEQFIKHGNNLYHFLKYIETQNAVSINAEDLKKGILGWDMGLLVCLVRAAQETGFINEKKAWKYIELAGEKCKTAFQDSEEIDKSFLIGYAMKTKEVKDWEELIRCYKLVKELDEKA